ncbi:MAG TPA: hypothetical protein PLR59_05700, partial [Brevundimonas sp.]|nr:hypothetical protein [Brevundimonas sp.]
ARGGVPSARVSIAVGARDVPLEQATSLGLVLLEYLNTLKAQRGAVALAVTLDEDGQERSLNLVVTDGEGPAPADMPLFEAITEQLGGRLLITRGAAGGSVRITFPVEIKAADLWNPVAVSLH